MSNLAPLALTAAVLGGLYLATRSDSAPVSRQNTSRTPASSKRSVSERDRSSTTSLPATVTISMHDARGFENVGIQPIAKFVKYGEVVTFRFDLKRGTASVVPLQGRALSTKGRGSVNVVFKDPDSITEGIREAIRTSLPNGSRDEQDALYERIYKKLSKFVEYGDYIVARFNLSKETAKVLTVREAWGHT